MPAVPATPSIPAFQEVTAPVPTSAAAADASPADAILSKTAAGLVAPATLLSPSVIGALISAEHGDPFSLLGLHHDEQGRLWARALLPGANKVAIVDSSHEPGRLVRWLNRIHPDGLFDALLPIRKHRFAYRLRVHWDNGVIDEIDDPYRFGLLLGDTDLWLFAEGKHLRPFEALGAHPTTVEGVAGTRFAVWAPNARRLSVIGDFNRWDGRRHPMRLRRQAGIWELFVPRIGAGERYKYELIGADGHLLPHRADPYAFAAELRPATASVVSELLPQLPAADPAALRRNQFDQAISIYEVHAGSWRRKVEEGNRPLNWRELADELIPYVQHMGFTHIELLPISEHPFDGSWGYQPTGMYAATARFGTPWDFREFVARCHRAGIGVIVDWVPAHFPSDAHGLGNFDGTALYEHADPREGVHKDWNTLIYNFGRNEVVNFLIGSALYWFERFGIDGMRVDAVASMLYRDYSREHGQWLANAHGGRENLEAVAFVRRLNEVIGTERPGAMMDAEESTAWPMVTRPPSSGGLGFHYKWNMGWMHDTLQYLSRDPIHRRHHQNELSFGLIYAFDENFILPLSHDEVVHGKGSLLARMPGDRWQKFANLRAYLAFQFAHPGKKLLFMGCEFAQEREWTHEHSLDWHLLSDEMHRGVQSLVRDLNHAYRRVPALHQRDVSGDGFSWIDHEDSANSVVSFIRWAGDGRLVVAICNFTPVPRYDYCVGVPKAGYYREILNTDSAYYGGSNVGNPDCGVSAQTQSAHGLPFSLSMTLPPLATVLLEWVI